MAQAVSSRVKKSRSILWTLYSLSGMAVFLYSTLFFFYAFFIVQNWSFDEGNWLPIVGSSLSIAGFSILMALPFAALILLSLLYREGGQSSQVILNLLQLVDKTPILLYGTFFLFFIGPTRWSALFTLTVIGAFQLASRWYHLTLKVSASEIETAQSLGMSFRDRFITLFLLPRFKWFLAHMTSVFCNLTFVVTPLVCLRFFDGADREILALRLFRNLGAVNTETSGLLVVILLLYTLKHVIDRRMGFERLEYV
ncbi:MAG: hypothetical protein AAF203_08730 [Pseudomonadota bacterium]